MSASTLSPIRHRTEGLLDATREAVRSRRTTIDRVAFPLAVAGVAIVLGWMTLRGLGLDNLQDWDESRHIVSAYEMWRSGDYLVNTYLGVPDYWNLKPPLSFWAIVAGMRTFGFTPFGVRIPSLLAAYLTIAVVTFFAYRKGGRVAAVVAMGVTASSHLLLNFHSGRTADPDALFNLFMTVAALAGVAALRRPYLLALSTTAVSLAFLTKSFHACLAIAFLAVLLVWMRHDSRVRPRHLLVGLAGFLPVVAWALARYSVDGGQFLAGMVQYDLLTRGSTTIEGHSGPPWLYVQFVLSTMAPWFVLGFGALCVVLQSTSVRLSRLVRPAGTDQVLLGLALWTVMITAAFSVAVSKLYWYVTDTVGAIAVVCGLLVAAAVRRGGPSTRVVLAATGAAALALGFLALHDAKTAEGPTPTQVAMRTIDRDPRVAGATVFLDGSYGAMSQSVAAAAELYLDGRPREGGLDEFLAASGTRALVVPAGSEDYRVAAAGPGTTVLEREADGVVVLVRR